MADVHKDPVIVRLSLAYACKHSVRYNADTPEGREAVTSLYLMSEAYDLLEQPQVIEVSVKAIQ